jgi:fumarylacetoacetase
MTDLNRELPQMQSWVTSANDPACGFSLGNLPYCAFRHADGSAHLGVGIGSFVLDLHALSAKGHLDLLEDGVAQACREPHLNDLMRCGPAAWSELRKTLTASLHASASDEIRASLAECLFAVDDVRFTLPVSVSNYTDFYASIEHATNVGRLFRPDQPLLPNYMYVPIAYHGRASSLLVSGEPIRRPWGQTKAPTEQSPTFRASSQLDYELEVGAYVGLGNPLGTTIPVASAEQHIFGFCLLNDWSARDIQSWEYQPLGPFLGKNFGTSLSPWVVALEALAPFRVPRAARPAGNPEPLDYLDDGSPETSSAIEMTLEVYLSTARMRAASLPPVRLSRCNLRDLYWSFAQMIAHHTSNGCNLVPGDLLGSGTVSGSAAGSEGSLLEITRRGQSRIELSNGESRGFLEDGDEIILRGYCERPGVPRVSLGECRAIIEPARPYALPEARERFLNLITS